MIHPFLTTCPSCNSELTATRLTCHNCHLELTKDFPLSPFLKLTKEEQDFLLLFLQNNGNLKQLQQSMKISYPAAKRQLDQLKKRLGLLPSVKEKEPEISLKEIPVYDTDSLTVQKIKKHLNEKKGRALLPLPRGNSFYIYYEEYGNGIVATNIPKSRILTWKAFDCAVLLLSRKNGRAEKGNAMKAKLGEPALSLDSVEGYVAANAYGVKTGESTLRIISPLSAILEWAGVCRNGYGFLELL